MTLDQMIAAWHEHLASTMQDPQTVSDYSRSLELFRQDLQRAGIDLDYSDHKKIAEIATGWKHLSLKGRPVSWEAANQRLTGLRGFYRFANQQGWLSGNPIP